MDQEERRSAKRYRFRFPLKVTWDGTRELMTQTVEVSSRGVYFFLSESLPVGTPIEFVLTLYPDPTESKPVRLQCQGRILRIVPLAEDQIGIAASIDQYEFDRS
jgi:PilZ domain